MYPEEILADLIRIPSVNPPGGESAVALYLKSIFDQAGIPNEIVEPAQGRGSFLAHWGEGPRKLLFLSHTDVVPPGEGWDFDPFAGEIKDGFVYGRGALDCKGLVAAEAAAMLSLAREASLKGTLIFAATADEEKGGNYGIKELLRNHREKIAADFAVNEGAEEPLRWGEQTIYFFQVGEKGIAWSKLKTKGVACHGSTPALGENAILRMVEALNALCAYRPEVVFLPEQEALFKVLATLKGEEGKEGRALLTTLVPSFQKSNPEFGAFLEAITRLTISPNVIKGGIKTNMVPDSCEVEVDIRVLPGQDRLYVQRVLQSILPSTVEVTVTDYFPSSSSPVTTLYYRLLEETLQEICGEVACVPTFCPGATDSRFLRQAGIPAYGISVLAQDFDSVLRRTVHGKNERIDVKSLRQETAFLIALARRYLT